MNAIAEVVPELFGGAADLTSSTKTIFKPGANFHVDAAGRNVFFGVREFAMSAAVNGIAAHGGLVPFGSTFFVFSDYCKPALRAVPGLTDFRPADANETAAAWRLALERTGPSFFALSRQDLPVIDSAALDVYAGVSKGAYVLQDVADPQIVLIGTGAEVWPALLPAGVPKLAVEAGVTLAWWKYVGLDGDVIGLDRFGASAPGATVLKELGFSAENVAARAKKLVKRS